MKALLLLTSVLSISTPVYNGDYFSVHDNPYFYAHTSSFFKETEAPIRNESMLQLQTRGTTSGIDIKDLINKYNYISFLDPEYEDYFADTNPYRSVYFNIKVQLVIDGNVSPAILYEENYGANNIPYSLNSLNSYGTTYLEYTSATRSYINSLNDTAEYHLTLNYYFPIKNFKYPYQIGDEITLFVFDVYTSNAKHHAYILEEKIESQYNDGYNDGLDFGYVDGYDDGYDDGLASQVNPEMSGFFGLLRQGFNSISSILAIQLFPGFTLGLLLFLPLIFGIAYTLIKLLLGGG